VGGYGRARAILEPQGIGVKRVLIIGPGGAGKSTLAVRFSRATGLPVIHLDALYWHPGWRATPREDWRKVVAELVERDAWVMDGNYSNTLDLRLAAADTIIYLDWPRLRCVWGLIRRRLRFAGRDHPSRAEGCPERLTLEFLVWVWRYPERTRPHLLQQLNALPPEKTVVTLRNRREVEALLRSVAGPPAPAAPAPI
jgi:adenylate kinase family enzyme